MAKKVKLTHVSDEDARQELKDVVGCLSCGLPTERTQREVASEVADMCPHCPTSDGHMKSYEEVFERLVTQHYMKHQRMSRPEAEEAARVRLSELPAWKDKRF